MFRRLLPPLLAVLFWCAPIPVLAQDACEDGLTVDALQKTAAARSWRMEEITGDLMAAVVSNYNAVPPRSHLAPDHVLVMRARVVHRNGESIDVMALIFVKGACVILMEQVNEGILRQLETPSKGGEI